METIIARIKGYAKVLDTSLVNVTDALLDLIVRDVVDRALAYMNRQQLVAQYELDLLDDSVEEEDYQLPIPTELERALAGVVVGAFKTVEVRNDSQTGAVTSISDNGQSINYSENVVTFLNSSDDSQIFSGAKVLLDRYILGKVIENTIYPKNNL
jgi:hypothetical protein